MLVYAGACVCVCALACLLRIVSRDKISRFKNTCYIYIHVYMRHKMFFCLVKTWNSVDGQALRRRADNIHHRINAAAQLVLIL